LITAILTLDAGYYDLIIFKELKDNNITFVSRINKSIIWKELLR